MYHEVGYTLVHKHVYGVYSAVLGLQFACMCNPNLACIPDMHTCIVHASSAYTRALQGRFDVTNLACTHRLARVRNEKRVMLSQQKRPLKTAIK